MALPTQLARDLLPLVNVPDIYDILLEYAEDRIKTLQQVLEMSNDILAISRVQGQINELRRLQGLQAEANADAKRIKD